MVEAKAGRDQVVKYWQYAALYIVPSVSDPVAHFPYFKGETIANNSMGHSLPRQDAAMPANPNDGFELPRELGHGLEPEPSWDEVFVAKASPSLRMEEETWVGDVPAAKAGAFPNLVVNQTNIHNDGCVFGNMTRHSHQEARVAVDPTIHVAEERHQAYISAANHAHLQEMEHVRREASHAHHQEMENMRREAQHALQEMASRHVREDQAEVARNTRLRELELAFELQGNEMRTLQREKESAAEAAQAHARQWAANKSDASSSGGALYYDISSGGTGASQPGVLNSLARNVFGYTKGPLSETTTAAPTAGGYEGRQGSLPIRQLFPINLYGGRLWARRSSNSVAPVLSCLL